MPSNKTCMMVVPATVTVLLFIGKPTAVDPLHCTTVSFSLVTAVIVRVEVMSAKGPVAVVMRLAVFVKVATKEMLLHWGGATSLQSTLLPTGVLSSMNRIRLKNGSTSQSRVNPCTTVQVCHHLSRTGLPHTHTGVQDNSSCTSRTTYIS